MVLFNAGVTIPTVKPSFQSSSIGYCAEGHYLTSTIHHPDWFLNLLCCGSVYQRPVNRVKSPERAIEQTELETTVVRTCCALFATGLKSFRLRITVSGANERCN